VATAEQTYVDPSALSRLYLRQPGSREISIWRNRIGGTLPITHHGRVEIINAINLAVFRKELPPEKAAASQTWLAEDFIHGHLTQVDILWRASLNRAAELSQAHTRTFGTRSLDILHVACAIELKLRHFLTFDERQGKLATALGLKLVHI
jgi:predicted nucleic acid-binding protein